MAESWEGEHGYAPKNHDHDSEYSKLGHTHAGIGSLPSHNHDTVYSKLGHDHDDRYSKLDHVHNYAASDHNHDDVYSKLGHSHELIDMLPVGTVLWFGRDVELSNKWTVYIELIGRYPLGSMRHLGDTVEAGLPNITGHITGDTEGIPEADAYWNVVSGAFYKDTSTSMNLTGNSVVDDDNYSIGFDASRCNDVYGRSDTVTPPSVNLIPYIKIA